jgi:hypothetical protein
MKKVLTLLAMLMAIIGLSATISYGTISYSSVPTASPKFYQMYATTTVAVGDTAANYIDSTPFTSAKLSNSKNVTIYGVVSTACQHTASSAVGMLRPELMISVDGTNYTTIKVFYGYEVTGATVGTTCMVPTNLFDGIYAPYVKIRWRGLSAVGVAYTADIFGAIKTYLIVDK